MHCILFVTDSSRNYLSVDVIMQLLLQATFNWKWFIQKLQKEALFWFMNKDNSFSMLIILWTASSTHHLQNISNRKIHISFCLCIIIFCSLYNDQMCWKVHTPCQCTCTDQNLDLVVCKKFLNQRSVLIIQSSMMQPNTKL
nr:hypothetical protein Iba_chr09fCG9650 [Ipomoea batatas]